MLLAVASGSSFAAFFRLGVEHIFTGYDHLFFLLGLLLVCRRWTHLVTIITAFTVGHSLTLALATLGWVNPPGRWIEALIALSILFVGVENLARRGAEPPGRWALALLFGLVHGFGFATVLRELGVGEKGGAIALPLLAFNLGVELGQLVFAAFVLPFLWLGRRHPAFVRFVIPSLSAMVALAGAYWLLERLVLG